eukprot:gene19423-963_t
MAGRSRLELMRAAQNCSFEFKSREITKIVLIQQAAEKDVAQRPCLRPGAAVGGYNGFDQHAGRAHLWAGSRHSLACLRLLHADPSIRMKYRHYACFRSGSVTQVLECPTSGSPNIPEPAAQ